MVQLLALAALVGDRGSVPNTHNGVTAVHNSTARRSSTLSWPLHCTHTHTHTHTHTAHIQVGKMPMHIKIRINKSSANEIETEDSLFHVREDYNQEVRAVNPQRPKVPEAVSHKDRKVSSSRLCNARWQVRAANQDPPGWMVTTAVCCACLTE